MTTKTEFKNQVNICKKAKKYWETLPTLSAAGSAFILDDGKVLDMIRKSDGRPYGHDDVSMAYGGKPFGYLSFLKNCNAIRFFHYDGVVTFEAVKKPNEKQIKTIIKDIKESQPEKMSLAKYNPPKKHKDMFIDNREFQQGYHHCILETNKPRPMDIQKWISKCWR